MIEIRHTRKIFKCKYIIKIKQKIKNFILDCGTFYCSKCSEALSNLENACWVCDTPFNESKPSKPFDREEDEVVVEEGVSKKGGGDTE